MKLNLIIFFILGFCCYSYGNDEKPITVKASVSPFIIRIGDMINYTFEIKSLPTQSIEIPDLEEQLVQFYTKDRIALSEKIENGQKITYLNLRFYTYDAGKHIIPPLKIKYGTETIKKEMLCASVYVRVDSLLNPDEKDIREIVKPKIIKNAYKINKKLIIIFVIIMAIILSYYFYKRKKMYNNIKTSPPWEEALNDLNALIESDYIINNKYKEYYFKLSDILRFYIEKRFRLSAPERTTEEFIKLMQNEKVLSENHKNLIKQFLINSDLVKFAKVTPQKSETDKVTTMVKSFIEETIPLAEKDDIK